MSRLRRRPYRCLVQSRGFGGVEAVGCTTCDKITATRRRFPHVMPNFPRRHAILREHQQLVLADRSRSAWLWPERRQRCPVVGRHLSAPAHAACLSAAFHLSRSIVNSIRGTNTLKRRGDAFQFRSPPSEVGQSCDHSARMLQTSIFSAMSSASSISTPRCRTVLAIFGWPSKSCTALRFPVRR